MRKNFLVLGFAIALTALFSGCDKFGFGKSEVTVDYIPVQSTTGGSWSFIDAEGNPVGDQDWEFEPTVTKGGMFTARLDSGLTVYKWNKTVAEPMENLRNLLCVGEYNEGLRPIVRRLDRISIVNGDGEEQFKLEPVDGKEIVRCGLGFYDGLLIIVNEDYKYGAIDTEGNVVIKPKFDELTSFNDGVALGVTYNPNDYEAGPTLYIVNKADGKSKKVKGKFGYPEGEGFEYEPFNHGKTYAWAPMDTTTYSMDQLSISVDGNVEKVKGNWAGTLENGSYALNTYSEEGSTGQWLSETGEKIKDVKNGTYSPITHFMVSMEEKGCKVFDLEGNKILSFGNGFAAWPGGDFGPVVTEYDENYNIKGVDLYYLVDKKENKYESASFKGVGTSSVISFSQSEEEGYMEGPTITSAYIDVTAAASSMASMLGSGSVKGKDYYYLGQPLTEMLKGENAQFYNAQTSSISIPTDTTYYLAKGAGFWVNGTAEPSGTVVSPTYTKYFDHVYTDYYGTRWGYWRNKQTGVKFNPSCKVAAFNLVLSTNHPSGDELRSAVGRHLKKQGFTLVSSGTNYDEYHQGDNGVIIYGSKDSKGIGALVKKASDLSKLSDEKKNTLAAEL